MTAAATSQQPSAWAGLVERTDDTYRLHTSVYHDESLFQAELEQIFERTWVYVCHESEIPNPGAYLTATLGRQPVIAARAEDGVIRVFLNVCRHRGATLCRFETGNANFFRCPYHGWMFSNTGKLTGIPQRRTGYADDFGSDLNLVQVPKVAAYRGLLFASLSPDVPTLEDWLGTAREYVDLWADRSIGAETKLAQPAHTYSYAGNWKLQAENGADGYHGNYTHESFFKVLQHFGERNVRDVRSFRESGCTRAFENGHCLLERPGPRRGNPIDGKSATPVFDAYVEQLEKIHGPARTEKILTQRNLLIFPNLYLFDRSIRVIRPRTVTETDVAVYFTWLEGVDDQLNKDRMSEHQRFFGTAGFGTPDDLEVFTSVSSATRSGGLEWLVLERGLLDEKVMERGERVGHSTSETPQRAFYDQWHRMLQNAGGTR